MPVTLTHITHDSLTVMPLNGPSKENMIKTVFRKIIERILSTANNNKHLQYLSKVRAQIGSFNSKNGFEKRSII